MLNKHYRECSITQTELEFLIQFPSGNKILIKSTRSFEDCQKWIDRQQAHLAVEKAFGNK